MDLLRTVLFTIARMLVGIQGRLLYCVRILCLVLIRGRALGRLMYVLRNLINADRCSEAGRFPANIGANHRLSRRRWGRVARAEAQVGDVSGCSKNRFPWSRAPAAREDSAEEAAVPSPAEWLDGRVSRVEPYGLVVELPRLGLSGLVYPTEMDRCPADARAQRPRAPAARVPHTCRCTSAPGGGRPCAAWASRACAIHGRGWPGKAWRTPARRAARAQCARVRPHKVGAP